MEKEINVSQNIEIEASDFVNYIRDERRKARGIGFILGAAVVLAYPKVKKIIKKRLDDNKKSDLVESGTETVDGGIRRDK